MSTNIDLLSFFSQYPIDKIISDFDGSSTSHTVGAATLSGGFYLPKTDTLQVANPAGKKAAITMIYSYNDSGFYPQKPRLYQPGNPVPTGKLGASVGATVDEEYITFYFTHYLGVSVDFDMFWVLDYLDSTTGDTTVPTPETSDTGILFTSQKNYMKRDSSSGSDTMLGPNTNETFYYTRDYTIDHNLGITPLFRVYYEPYNDGRVMEAYNDGQGYFSDPINTYGGTEDAPVCFTKADNNQLTITLYFLDSSLSASSFPIYWVIYRDYGLVA